MKTLVTLAHRLLPAHGLVPVPEDHAFRRMARDAIAQYRKTLGVHQAGGLGRLVDHHLLHRQLIDRHSRHAFWTSGQQHRRAHGARAFEIGMDLPCIGEWVALADLDLDRANKPA